MRLCLITLLHVGRPAVTLRPAPLSAGGFFSLAAKDAYLLLLLVVAMASSPLLSIFLFLLGLYSLFKDTLLPLLLENTAVPFLLLMLGVYFLFMGDPTLSDSLLGLFPPLVSTSWQSVACVPWMAVIQPLPLGTGRPGGGAARTRGLLLPWPARSVPWLYRLSRYLGW